MHLHQISTLLCTFLIFLAQNVTARPTEQRPLLDAPPPTRKAELRPPVRDSPPSSLSTSQQHRRTRHRNSQARRGYHVDPAPDTVGVLFGGRDNEDAVHVWLPLGRRVFTSDIPLLPAHPHTARITTVMADSPQRASSEFLAGIMCFAYFAKDSNFVGGADADENEPIIVGFSRKDGVVSFGVNWRPF